MSRETIYRALILKKQPLNEADEIITLYTLELGKLRVLAKSSKSAQSKLQHALQSLFLVDARVAGRSSFPKLIGAEVKQTFAGIREDLDAAKYALYASELALKFSADEQINESLFYLLKDFFSFLDAHESNSNILFLGLAKFKMALLDALGLGLPAQDLPVQELQILFNGLNSSAFEDLPGLANNLQALPGLQKILSEFIKFQLEREVKAEGLMDL